MASEDSGSATPADWIEAFCSKPGNEFFCKIEEDYIKDRFNLTGLAGIVPQFHHAIKLILDKEPMEDAECAQSSAELLYGMIHVRFIMTEQGMAHMLAKWMLGQFGVCRRVHCEAQRLLPIGLSDVPGDSSVKVYCARCMEVYMPDSSRHQHIDGAYFGTGFPHMLFLTHPEFRPQKPTNQFTPSLYGFRIHPRAYLLQATAAAAAHRSGGQLAVPVSNGHHPNGNAKPQ